MNRFPRIRRLLNRLDRFMCDTLDWHKPSVGMIGNDGASNFSCCRYCGRRVLEDSQGNWFSASGSTRFDVEEERE